MTPECMATKEAKGVAVFLNCMLLLLSVINVNSSLTGISAWAISSCCSDLLERGNAISEESYIFMCSVKVLKVCIVRHMFLYTTFCLAEGLPSAHKLIKGLQMVSVLTASCSVSFQILQWIFKYMLYSCMARCQAPDLHPSSSAPVSGFC